MCRHLTREQRIEGWRAFARLLAGLWPKHLGVRAAALVARPHPNGAAAGRRATGRR